LEWRVIRGVWIDCSKLWDRAARLTLLQQLSSKINNSIEKQMVNAASSGKLTIMKGKGGEIEPYVPLSLKDVQSNIVVNSGAGKGKGKGKGKA